MSCQPTFGLSSRLLVQLLCLKRSKVSQRNCSELINTVIHLTFHTISETGMEGTKMELTPVITFISTAKALWDATPKIWNRYLYSLFVQKKQRPAWQEEDGLKRWIKQLQVVTISCHLCEFIVPVWIGDVTEGQRYHECHCRPFSMFAMIRREYEPKLGERYAACLTTILSRLNSTLFRLNMEKWSGFIPKGLHHSSMLQIIGSINSIKWNRAQQFGFFFHITHNVDLIQTENDHIAVIV